jgi:hypothetical protein
MRRPGFRLPPLAPVSPGTNRARCALCRSRGSRSTGGPLACNQQMGVQFPPLPPSSPGRPSRSRRQSEKLDKHVRLVLLAPNVAVAEWSGGGLWNRPRGFDFLRPPQSFFFRDSQAGKAPHCYCGHAQVRILLPEPCGVNSAGRVPLLQSGCPWFDSRTPYHFFRSCSSMEEQPTDNRPTKVRFFPEAPCAGGPLIGPRFRVRS